MVLGLGLATAGVVRAEQLEGTAFKDYFIAVTQPDGRGGSRWVVSCAAPHRTRQKLR